MTPRTAPNVLAGFCLLLLVLVDTVGAAELRSLEMGEEGERLWLKMTVTVAAPPAAVFSVITDYDNIRQLHRNVIESELVRRIDPRTVEVYTLIRGCIIAVFCRRIRRVERITEYPPDRLDAEVLAEQSDLAYGRVLWRLEAAPEGSMIYYESEIEPEFWVPKLFGDALLAKMVERTTIEMIERVEALARALPAGDDGPAGEALPGFLP